VVVAGGDEDIVEGLGDDVVLHVRRDGIAGEEGVEGGRSAAASTAVSPRLTRVPNTAVVVRSWKPWVR
jgi:hypothetical protein